MKMKKVIEIAENEIGYKDDRGVSKYFSELFPNERYRPWCLPFVEWAFMKAYGKEKALSMLYMPNGEFISSVPAFVNLVKRAKMWRKKNVMPAFLVFLRTNGEWTNHVELVTDVTEKEVFSVGGNCGGVVRKNIYSRDDFRISGYAEIHYG